MGMFSPGFTGRPRAKGAALPPGQYLTTDFPVLSAGPTPRITTDQWEFTLTTETGQRRRWDWKALLALPVETITTDLHCVTQWSKLGTTWRGVPVDALLSGVDTAAEFAMATCYGGYTTNLQVTDLVDGKAWIAFEYDGAPLHPEHGGPARLLVPHLYLWKSAKWIAGLRLMERNQPGFWENLGYHDRGDPWLEQRYAPGAAQ
jgi:DMSO/TMAO reductase YedYZ molybdopterin-dependent catalytic subunit